MAAAKKKPNPTPPPTSAPQAGDNKAHAEQPQQQQGVSVDAGRARKKEVITMLQKRIADPVWMERLLKIAHGDESKILRALNSYCTFIANDQGSRDGNDRKYICNASLSSLFTCFLEAFSLGLDIGGGRDFVAVVVYGAQAELEVTYKGFVNALSRHFDNPFVQFGNIFDGDVFIPRVADSTATFIHEPKDPFTQNYDQLKGAYCYFSYTNRENKKEVSRLVWIDKAGIVMIRSKARSQKVWNEWWGEMVLKAIIRRASKIPFASIDFDEQIADPSLVDNKHFLLEDKSTGKERLGRLLEKQQEIMDDDKVHEGDDNGSKKPTESTKDEPAHAEAAKDTLLSPDAPSGEMAKQADEGAVRFPDNDPSVIEGHVVHSQAPELTDADFEEGNDHGK